MLKQIKKDLQHPFAPVKRRFVDGRIVFYYSTIKCFDDIPQDVKDNLKVVAEKYGGYADGLRRYV